MDKAKEDKSKRRKVGTACIYCRRSHMTCDEGRPCKRCIKRDIGHLCHDESTSRPSHGGDTTRRWSQTSNSSPPAGKAQSPPTANTVPQASPSLPPSAFVGQGEGVGATLLGAERTASSPNLTLNLEQSNAITGINWGSSVLGGAGFLGLGGAGFSSDGDMTASGDAAGGNEFNILSEFLESLDGGSSIPTPGVTGASFASNGGTSYDAGIPSSFPQPSPHLLASTGTDKGDNALDESPAWPAGTEPSSGLTPGWTSQATPNAPLSSSALTSSKTSRRPSLSDIAMTASSSGLGGLSAKTENFFLTAADQKDGTRDERLGRVIQAKYEAGLLRPYNHVNGYARLNRWMEQNASQASRRRILKPLSIFRPAFRAVAQSLTNVDLIFIEEAFERLLLDYDRVFSTQGIPACLWRRTGEIYKGNKEFAELVGVGIEALRDGRCTIYELMQEESAVNYWEKYGAVSFDPGQKAVLTSCVLKTKGKSSAGTGRQGEQEGATKAKSEKDTFVSCCFSFTIRRDAWSIPCLIVGNFLPLQ